MVGQQQAGSSPNLVRKLNEALVLNVTQEGRLIRVSTLLSGRG